MAAAGTIRTAVNARLVELIGDLDGYSVEPGATGWWVTRPPNGQKKSRKFVIIGVGSGTTEVDGISAGHGPSIDDWTIGCLIEASDASLSLAELEQDCETAFNEIADALAADHRIGMRDGPQEVQVTGEFEIGSGQDQGKPPFAYLAFTIGASASIERNP